MKPKPMTPIEARAEHDRRMAIPGAKAMRETLHKHRQKRVVLERQIARAGQAQRAHGPLNAQDGAKLKKARADLDALNETIHQQRRKMKA